MPAAIAVATASRSSPSRRRSSQRRGIRTPAAPGAGQALDSSTGSRQRASRSTTASGNASSVASSVFFASHDFADVRPAKLREVLRHLVERRRQLAELVSRRELDPLVEAAFADGVGPARQPPQRTDDRASSGATPRPRQHQSAASVMSSTARRDAPASSRAPVTARASQLEMSIANHGRQRDRAPQQRIRLLVILHERFPFGGHGDHARPPRAGRPAAPPRAGCASSRSSAGPSTSKRSATALSTTARSRASTCAPRSVAGEDEQHGVVFPFERAGEPST